MQKLIYLISVLNRGMSNSSLHFNLLILMSQAWIQYCRCAHCIQWLQHFVWSHTYSVTHTHTHSHSAVFITITINTKPCKPLLPLTLCNTHTHPSSHPPYICGSLHMFLAHQQDTHFATCWFPKRLMWPTASSVPHFLAKLVTRPIANIPWANPWLSIHATHWPT